MLVKEKYKGKSKCGILVCLFWLAFYIIADILVMIFSFQFSQMFWLIWTKHFNSVKYSASASLLYFPTW